MIRKLISYLARLSGASIWIAIRVQKVQTGRKFSGLNSFSRRQVSLFHTLPQPFTKAGELAAPLAIR